MNVLQVTYECRLRDMLMSFKTCECVSKDMQMSLKGHVPQGTCECLSRNMCLKDM